MQSADKTQASQQAVAAAETDQRCLPAASGPIPVAPELLQLVGGGKGVPLVPTDATAPVNKW